MEISGLVIAVLLATFVITGSIMFITNDEDTKDSVIDTTKMDEMSSNMETYTNQMSAIGESATSTAVGFLGLGALIRTLLIDSIGVASSLINQLTAYFGLGVIKTTVIACVTAFVVYQAILLYRGVKG